MMKISIITILIWCACFQAEAQSKWQTVTFDFNNEHIIESVDSITKFQYIYTTLASVDDRWYHWYDSIIHKTRGGYAAKLLDGKFSQYDKKGNLCIQGHFLNGLKSWTWKYWYSGGQLRKIENWNEGIKNGVFVEYTSSGKIISSIAYKNGLLNGAYVIYKADTIFTQKEYKKGVEVVNKKHKR